MRQPFGEPAADGQPKQDAQRAQKGDTRLDTFVQPQRKDNREEDATEAERGAKEAATPLFERIIAAITYDHPALRAHTVTMLQRRNRSYYGNPLIRSLPL